MTALTEHVKRLATEAQTVVFVGYRGYGSGGWFAGCNPREDLGLSSHEIESSSPQGAVNALENAMVEDLKRVASKAERERNIANTTLIALGH